MEEAAKKPPESVKVCVVVAPRPVTVAKVSFAKEETGQFVPLFKQTVWPFTNNCVVEAIPETKILVVVTLVAVVLPDKIVEPTTCKVELGLVVPIPKLAPVLM